MLYRTEKQLLLENLTDMTYQYTAFDMIGAEYKTFRDRIEAEKDIYFVPSMRTRKSIGGSHASDIAMS